MALPLDEILVFEAATTVAGQLLGRLLASQGAGVATLRPPANGFARRFLFRDKRSGWPQDTTPHVVLVDGNPTELAGELREEAIELRWPNATYVSITPHGRSGRWAEIPGDDVTADAMSGIMSLRGTAAGGPNAAAPHVIQQLAAYAAFVALLQHLLRDGPGMRRTIDVSLAETALLTSEMHGSYVTYAGIVPQRRLQESMTLFGMMRTADGWIMAHNWLDPGWAAANALLDGEGLTKDVAAGQLTDLARHADEIRASVAPWFAERSKWDLTREAQAMRLHWGASATVEDLLSDPHVQESAALEEVHRPGEAPVRLPRLALRPIQFERIDAPMPDRPPRVLDLTHYWAGPACARMLADFGMDVIKIEPPQKPDPVRLQIPLDNEPEPRPLERGWWNGLNVGKRSLSLDMRSGEGRDAFLTLVAESDVVLENFSATAMEHWGLGWETLRRANPSLVYVSMSAFGSRGPYRSYIAFGANMEPLAGIPELVGDSEGAPILVPSVTPDTFGAFVGAAAVLAGLLARKAGGAGTWIELSQHQALLGLIAWAFDHSQTTGEVPRRSRIHTDGHAYRGVLQCIGEDSWLALSIREAAAVDRARQVIGAAEGVSDDAAFRAWAASKPASEAAMTLRGPGIAVMPVLDVEEGLGHELFAERKSLRTLEAAAGFMTKGMTVPFLVDGERLLGNPKTPAFGSSTREILERIAGLSSRDVDRFIAAGIAADQMVVDWSPAVLPLEEWIATGAARRTRGGGPG